MTATVNIRVATAADVPALAELFRQTVLHHAPSYYSPAQTQAWASSGTDNPQFRQLILEVTTYVAVDSTGVLGFAGIGETGYVASAYVRHDCLRQGIGSALMQAVLGYAQTHHLQRLYTEASEFSLGLFQKFGFRIYDTEVVERCGVPFTRYRMELHHQG
ncbi:MAG: GNAT family N-acetyltransferase [Nodosilinea sp.]